eukprot:GHVR01046950.1.p2 GENE.GHVR01046950.1~~GHVR01046950.1.p2  ORF type:complete len:144 (+),score=2.17 GHVR01046950.1:2321-2752(+)
MRYGKNFFSRQVSTTAENVHRTFQTAWTMAVQLFEMKKLSEAKEIFVFLEDLLHSFERTEVLLESHSDHNTKGFHSATLRAIALLEMMNNNNQCARDLVSRALEGERDFYSLCLAFQLALAAGDSPSGALIFVFANQNVRVHL